MKKLQVWILILIILIPVIAFAITFIVTGLSIRETPLWIVTGIPILLFPFVAFLVKRYDAQPTDNPLKKQRRKFLALWGSYAVFMTIALIMAYYRTPQFFWTFLLLQICFLLSVFLLNIRLFFPKKEGDTKELG